MNLLLEGKALKKTYRPGSRVVEVLKEMDLSVQEVEMVVIVGPSGSGKSTLLSILGGLDRPTHGTVHFQGENLYGLADRQLAQIRSTKFGFVFQFYHLVPELTALENVALPAWIHGAGVSSKKVLQRAGQLLKQVGLSERVTHHPAELSGGEQQRVAIARALMNSPQLIFCDEPTGNLDSHTGGGILKLLVELHREQGTTFVIVTHEPSITKVASRVLSLKDGQLWA